MEHPINSRRVAIMVDHLYDYQVQLRHGFRSALDRAGLGSVTFVGRHLHPSSPAHRMANEVYGLIDPGRYHGLIVSAANFFRGVDDGALHRFLDGFDLPKVSVSCRIEGTPSVTVDNASGMRELMTHLVHACGYREFVLVGGIAGNAESQLREHVVTEFLNEHGLHLNPHRVLRGDFYSLKAAQEITRLLATDHAFEVVVCANDEMAFGVMQALTRHGLRVPQDVAVVGFDDVADARHARPALTTVAQPTTVVGERAVEVLLQLAHHGNVPAETVLPSALVRRESCGAVPDVTGSAWPSSEPSLLDLFEQAGRSATARATFLEWWRRESRRHGQEHAAIGAAMLALDAQAKAGADPHERRRGRAATLVSALVSAGVLGTPSTGHALGRNNQVSSQHELSLSSHERLETFELEVRAYMRSLDVQRYALVLYDEPSAVPAPSARLIGTSLVPQGSSEPYPTAQLLPDPLQHELDAGHLVVVPLFFGELHFGLLLFETPGFDGFDAEHVRYTLSCGLHHLHTTRQRMLYTQQLEEQVRARTSELETEIAERKKAEHALRRLNEELSLTAMTDPLTGIYNRAAFTMHYQREWARHAANGRPLSVLLCDVDRFKQFNDHYGHLAGDDCLRSVARALDSGGRHQRDFTARFGGEEFVLVLPDTDEEGAVVVAARLLRRVEDLAIEHAASSVAPHVTLSIGVATVVPEANLCPEDLLDRADRALYAAKGSGRNTCRSAGRDQFVAAPAQPGAGAADARSTT